MTEYPAPGSLTAGTPTASTIPLSWAAPVSGDSTASEFVVLAYVTSTGALASNTTVTNVSYTVTGLSQDTGYTLSVAASDQGSTAGTTTATTASLPPAAPPAGLCAAGSSPYALVLNWQAPLPECGVSVYLGSDLVVSATTNAVTYDIAASLFDFLYPVSGLAADTEYTVTVTETGTVSSETGTVSTTAVLAAPAGESSSTSSATVASLSWDAVSGADGYAWQLCNSGGSSLVSGYTASTSVSSVIVPSGATQWQVQAAPDGTWSEMFSLS
jgi:predicted secreted protein